MLGKTIGRITLVGISLFLIGISESAGWGQQPAKTTEAPSAVIAKIEDYVLTVKDLDQIMEGYPAGSVSSREEKLRVVESLITPKLFALAARTAKLDAEAEFPKAKRDARERALVNTYIQRHVYPKYSVEAAQKYFEAHKEELKYFSYYRNEIIKNLRKQAVADTTQSLMKQWRVKQGEDLKALDLRRADASLVLAQVEDKRISVSDLKQLAAQTYEPEEVSRLSVDEQSELLDWLVMRQLCLLEAEKTGLADDPAVRKTMAESEDLLLATRYTVLTQNKVTLEDARRYYQDHLGEFKGTDQVWLRHIVVAAQDDARSVKTKLNSGARFEEVAKAVSIDKSTAERGGDLGWVRKGRLYPEVEKLAFQLQPKQVSEPIRTPEGYVIVKMEERLAGTVNPFDRVASQILLELKTQAIEAERRRLMAVYKVTINKELL